MSSCGMTRPAGDVGLSAPETEAPLPLLIWQRYYCYLCCMFFTVLKWVALIFVFDTRIIYCLSVKGLIITLQTNPEQCKETGPFLSTYKNKFIQWTRNTDLSVTSTRLCISVQLEWSHLEFWMAPGEWFTLIFIFWKKMPIPLKRPLL